MQFYVRTHANESRMRIHTEPHKSAKKEQTTKTAIARLQSRLNHTSVQAKAMYRAMLWHRISALIL